MRAVATKAAGHLKKNLALGQSCRRYHYDKGTAKDMMKKSCYYGVNFIIDQDATVFEAITRMAGINLGCLAVSDGNNQFVGVVSERDYLKKVELQGLTAKTVQVSEIMTHKARLVHAKEHETPSELMTKMLNSDVRHLPVVDHNGDIIGMLSIKDIVREVNREVEADFDTLTSFSLGKVQGSLSSLGKHPISNKHIFTKLVVQNQQIEAIDILAEFPNLQDVDVADNQIETLAPLAHLPFLIALNASHNSLTTLLDFDTPQCTQAKAWVGGGEAIGSMLHVVNYAHNRLTQMRDLSRHRYIQELTLDHNEITDITGLSELVFLKHVSMAHNKLRSTSGLTANLPIETLDLSHNEISKTADLPRLPRLLRVNLAYNNVEALKDFGNCRMLQHLNVSFNRVRELHHVDALSNLRDLSHLDLSHCPITRIPHYRFRVLVRTPQVIELDTLPASVKERIKAQVLHGHDIQARREIFEKHLRGTESFVNLLPPLTMDFSYLELTPQATGHLFCLRKPNRKPETRESTKSFALEAAAQAILVAQVKVTTQAFAAGLLSDMPKRYPLLFGRGSGSR
ncbi:hypothetical protein ACHHYP_03309 [Achlya hypogyna]|uniref:CBS domain-containing protein n=1 Tax=Achlya hypogyna TaxID=1202772 RepID=A0A1V9Z3Y3_ACHHY|nr:hypothetical protein ACHHYP_03309 [Achlya hypogyna]